MCFTFSIFNIESSSCSILFSLSVYRIFVLCCVFIFLPPHPLVAESESRKAFRNMFPEAPITNRTLEDQQDAMLAQQEAQLRSLRERSMYSNSCNGQLSVVDVGRIPRQNLIKNTCTVKFCLCDDPKFRLVPNTRTNFLFSR